MFLAIIAFILGKAMESLIPIFGVFGYLNPASKFILVSFRHLTPPVASLQ